LNAIRDEQDLVAGAKCVSLGYELEDKAKHEWVGGFAMEKEAKLSNDQLNLQQQQVLVFFTKVMPIINYHYHFRCNQNRNHYFKFCKAVLMKKRTTKHRAFQ
jgi:hypothetical protein